VVSVFRRFERGSENDWLGDPDGVEAVARCMNFMFRSREDICFGCAEAFGVDWPDMIVQILPPYDRLLKDVYWLGATGKT